MTDLIARLTKTITTPEARYISVLKSDIPAILHDVRHRDECPWVALVAAVKGEQG